MKTVGHSDSERHLDHPQHVEVRGKIQKQVGVICEITRRTWKEYNDQGLPIPKGLMIVYDGSHGRGDVEAIFAHDGNSGWCSCFNHAANPWQAFSKALRGDPDRHVIQLVDALTGLSGHGKWRTNLGGRGEITVDVVAGVISHYVHTTRVVKFRRDPVDVQTLLGYEAQGPDPDQGAISVHPQ